MDNNEKGSRGAAVPPTRRIIGMLAVAALFVVGVPSRAHTQVDQDGRWVLSSIPQEAVIYNNAESVPTKVMLTVCSTTQSSAFVNARVSGSKINLNTIGPGGCSTLLVNVPAGGFLEVVNAAGGVASGTYSVTTPL